MKNKLWMQFNFDHIAEVQKRWGNERGGNKEYQKLNNFKLK